MKLSISLLVLAALSQAESPPSTTPENSGPNTPVTNPKANNQTSKRELQEENFEERNKELSPKYDSEATGLSTKILHQRNLNELVTDPPLDSGSNQIFGIRAPPIPKISDVLSQHGPSYEAAVAKHLYSPISVYQAKLSSPTSSQSEGASKMKLTGPQKPEYLLDRLKLRVESYPKPLDSAHTRQQLNLPQEIYRIQDMSKKPKFFNPVNAMYEQPGSYRYQGDIMPSQFLHKGGLYQIVPVQPGFDYGHQEANRGHNYPNHESHEKIKAELVTEMAKLHVNIPAPNHGFHAHPNGAVSFTSFSQKLPLSTQYNTAPQPKSESFNQQQPGQLRQQIQPEVMLSAQEHKITPVKPMVYRLIQELEKYEPVYQQQPQLMPFKQQIRHQPPLNALQHHLLFQVPRQFSDPQIIELQQMPAFKPLLTPDFLQQNRSPIQSDLSPRPFSYKDKSVQPVEHTNKPVEPSSTQRQLTSLSSLNTEYSKFDQTVKPHSHTTPVFLPTPVQVIPTSTPEAEPASDQAISSTTVQPKVYKPKTEPEKKLTQKETPTYSQTSLPPPAPVVIRQPQPEVIRQQKPIRSTTPAPVATFDVLPNHYHIYGPHHEHRSTNRPQSIKTSPRHEVVIQRQEIQELILEPTPATSQLHYHENHRQIVPQQEREAYQIRSQEHQQLFEQLQIPQFQQELQDLNSEQYLLETRQSQLHSHPLQLQLYLAQQQRQRSGQQNNSTQQHVKSDSKNQISTPKPSQEPEKQTKIIEQQIKSQPQQLQQSAIEKPEEQRINLLPPTLYEAQPAIESVAVPLQLDQPQMYGQPHFLSVHPQYSQLVGVPSYSDVQYFGKFAETLLGNRHY